MNAPGWATVIGLEVHVQMATRTKLFCACPHRFGEPPNTLVCPVCLGLPGALPALNRRALELGIRAGLACGATIASWMRFDRKNYFYPDLPKGYQISQFDRPLARGGAVAPLDGRAIPLNRIHIEEDAGKSMHVRGTTLIDLNRCGAPLLEIVTEPEIASPAEAHAFLEALKQLMRYSGVSECDMEKGSLRCDANLSLRPPGQTALGTKVEIKNLNSFRMVRRALEHEQERQAALLEQGRTVRAETRLWDDQAGETRPMRSKEEAHDYRYFPEPDLPPVRIDKETVDRIRGELPELPAARFQRFRDALGLAADAAAVLCSEREVAEFFEAAAAACGDARQAANWVQGELLRLVNESGATLGSLAVTPAAFGRLIELVAAGRLTAQAARPLLERLARTGGDPERLLAELGLARIDDSAELEGLVRRILQENPAPLENYLAGKESALQALMGRVMRATRGRAHPQKTLALLAALAEEHRGRAGRGSGP